MEKTFEELALELASARFWYNGDFVKTAANVMQQVREATIAECLGALNGYDYDERIKTEFENLPTDRIKTDK